ncbi:MAG: YlbF family regulator [Eubacteriales bacterium]|nr:YlbF family regulator [Eubacteriales bacterium]
MEKVLNQAEQLAEAILDSEEFIRMRLAEQAAMHDESAAKLISDYTEQRGVVEKLLATNNVDHQSLAEAGEKLEAIQKLIDENTMLKTMRETNAAFGDMMKQVNQIIKFVVTGEKDEQDGCTGNCGSCGGCH